MKGKKSRQADLEELKRLLARGFFILALGALAWWARDDLAAWHASSSTPPQHAAAAR